MNREDDVRHLLFAAAVFGVLAIAAFGAQTQNAPAQTPQPPRPAPSADPYAGNAAPGTTQFPLAAPAGKDSGAKATAPAGALNQGPFDPATWKYGGAFNPPANAKIWNPVKLKMMQGAKVTGGTVFSATDPATYCAKAKRSRRCPASPQCSRRAAISETSPASAKVRPTTSAPSTSSTTRRSRPGNACAVHWPGATDPISPVFRRGARRPRLRVESP